MKNILLLVTALILCLSPQIWAEEQTSYVESLEMATFAGGCFWCTQSLFDHVEGVVATRVGYTGGTEPDPDYKTVSGGKSGYAEAVEIQFDPTKVSYEKLLDIFWKDIDPTAVNRQFVDVGTQYRTVIFYHNERQKAVAEVSKKALADSGKFDKPIATQIVSAQSFYPAESYHQKYYKKNPIGYQRYREGSGRASLVPAQESINDTAPIEE